MSLNTAKTNLNQAGTSTEVDLYYESPKEREIIQRILKERQAIIDRGEAVWLDGEQVKQVLGL